MGENIAQKQMFCKVQSYSIIQSSPIWQYLKDFAVSTEKAIIMIPTLLSVVAA